MAELVNPYIAGAPVTEARMFFGREDVFQWIENSIAGQYADHILVIHGQRRVGKTSVLKQLGNRLPKRFIPVFFDLQGRTHTTLDRFLWWLAREIVRVLKQDHGVVVPQPDQQAFSADPEHFENQFLPGLRSVLGTHTLLLTFDEFDNLEESEVKEALAHPLIDYLRRLMGMDGLNFIFSIGSSGRKLENMQAAYTEFFKTALYKKISFLNEEQSHALITRPVSGMLEYERAAVERIYGISSGHPYFTQLTCHELFARCQRTEQRRIAQSDVEAILDDVVERGTVNLKFVWDESSDIEKWSLSALAGLKQADNRSLAAYLQKQHVRFSDSDLASGLLHLREKDVLTSENRFVIHLLRLWLQKNRPIEQAREELTEVNPIANRFIEIGLEFRDSGQYEKAIEFFRQALSVSPDNIQAQVSIALVYMDQKAYGQAVVEFEKALANDDEEVAARAGLCEAHLALGDAAMSRGRTKEATLSYRRVLAINAEHTEARGRMAELIQQRAEKALLDGKDEEALSAFAEALTYTPEDPSLIARADQVRAEKRARVLEVLLAQSEREAGAKNWEGAVKLLEQALSLAPDDAAIQKKLNEVSGAQKKSRLDGMLAKADAAAKAARWDEAIETLTAGLEVTPDVAIGERLIEVRAQKRAAQLAGLRNQARAMEGAERFDEALSAWDEYLALGPDDPEKAQMAIEGIKKAQVLAKSYAEAQNAYAKKNYDQAVHLLKGIIIQDENYKDASRLLAQAIELRRSTRSWWQSKWMRRALTISISTALVVLAVASFSNHNALGSMGARFRAWLSSSNTQPENLLFGDDFENPTYNGAINSSIWTGELDRAKQENGILEITGVNESQPLCNSVIYPVGFEHASIDKPIYFEADLKIDPGLFGSTPLSLATTSIQIDTVEAENQDHWVANCSLQVSNSTSFIALCVDSWKWDDPAVIDHEFHAPLGDSSLAGWHKLRIELDPLQKTVQFRFDDYLLGSFVPNNADELFSEYFHFLVGNDFACRNEKIVTYVDNVKIGLVETNLSAGPAGIEAPTATTATTEVTASTSAEEIRAFADPILAAVAQLSLPIVNEDFSQVNNGWPFGSSADGDKWGFADEKYAILVTNLHRNESGDPCLDLSPSQQLPLSDFVLEVEAQFISGTEGNWHLLLSDLLPGPPGSENIQYSINFFPDGTSLFAKAQDHTQTEIVKGLPPPAFAPGTGTHRVTIISQGNGMAVYFDEVPLFLVHNAMRQDALRKLEFGVCNEAGKDSPLEVRFDNLKVWEATGLSSHSAPEATTSTSAEQIHTFADPILTAISNKTPEYQDDFSNSYSGWPTDLNSTGNEYGYQDGAYLISNWQAKMIGGGSCNGVDLPSSRAFSDFVLEVDGRFINQGEGEWGVLFRENETAHYGADISPAGVFWFHKNVNGIHIPLLQTEFPISSFRSGNIANHLTLIAQGNQMAVYVNGEPVGMLTDSSSSQGTINLTVCDGNPLQVLIDNLKIWDIAGLSP